MTANRQRKNDACEIGDDLRITQTTRRAAGGGTWVIGTIADHKFSALVFPEHAENPDYEMDESCISKLWIQQIADKTTVVNFDRGWDVRPTTKIAAAIVDFLAAGLAELTYRT
jgi:hypothetical protein